MPEIEFTFRVDGVLTNPTSVVLSDPTGTFGVKRDDTQAVVVADGTAMTQFATGIYRHEFTAPVSGLAYTWYAEVVHDEATYFFEREFTDSGAAGGWYYADQQAVEDLIGEEALRLISNQPGATSAAATDTDRVQRVGEQVDAWIDARMTALGFVAPMTVDDTALTDVSETDTTRRLMRETSAKLVAWSLNEPRLLMTLSTPTARNASNIDQIMEAHRKSAEMTLNKISWRQLNIVADRLYDRPPYAKVYVPTEWP